MKTKIVIFAFAFMLLVLALVSVIKGFSKNDKDKSVRPIVVTPLAPSDSEAASGGRDGLSEDGVQTSLVPLLHTETLISTLTIDFDGDAFDDQIIAVRKAGSPYLSLIVGLYNPDANAYERAAEIPTEISRIRTFSYTGLDMIGDHRIALVYQGIKSDGDSVMNLYLCKKKRGVVNIVNIGSFSSDGTIFIQQTERSEAYELSQSAGKNYTVWVYSSEKSDENSSSAGITQVQTEYSWNPEKEEYVQSNRLKITGNSLAAKELARIQNGNVETFTHFLNGLWYKTSNESAKPNYIYFDYDNKEVILLSDDTEGVYSWEDSSLRRSGIYLSTVNSVISSMKRRFDIMLTGVNEVNIHVRDDVGSMVIKESNQWDGSYRKMAFQNVFGGDKDSDISAEYEKILVSQKTWLDDDRNTYIFENNGYKLLTHDGEESGIYVMDSIGVYPIVQFRTSKSVPYMQNAYVMRFKTEEITVPAKKRNQKPTVEIKVIKDEITLSPVRLAPDTVFASEGKTITLRKPESDLQN